MQIEVITDRKTRIIECHNGIHGSMKQALEYAFEAGQLLTEVKDEFNHGEFLPWLKENMPFSDKTAETYMKLHKHRCKIETVSNLQEAYRQIETIEQQEKQSEAKKQTERVRIFRETGVKPEGWRRGTDDKAVERKEREEQRREENFQKAKEQIKEQQEKREEWYEPEPDQTEEWIKDTIEEIQKEKEKHAHLNLSSYAENRNQDEMFYAIEKYLNSFDGVSAQLEAAHNLIKKLKMIVNDLQIKSVGIEA